MRYFAKLSFGDLFGFLSKLDKSGLPGDFKGRFEYQKTVGKKASGSMRLKGFNSGLQENFKFQICPTFLLTGRRE